MTTMGPTAMDAPEDPLEVTEAELRRMVEQQFPEWAGLPLERVGVSGTENALFRLGAELAVRLPLSRGSAPQVEKERRWLPWLSVRLPQSIPVPVALGRPTSTYPSPWSICRWIPGRSLRSRPPADEEELARQLGRFVRCLAHLDAREGPAPGAHNFFRGVALADRDRLTRSSIQECGAFFDPAALLGCWERDARAPAWTGAPVWIHGDLTPDNLVARDGRLAGVIDWGGLGVGDPATDLLPAWNLFDGGARELYREQLGVDDAAWRRGRGLALSVAVVALPFYLGRNDALVENSTRVIEQVLMEHAQD